MEAREVSDAAAHRRVLGKLREQAEDVRRLVAGLDEESLSKRTVPEKWSLKELVCHVSRVQKVFEGRLDAMLASDNPQIVSYQPEGDTVFEAMAARPAADCLGEYLSDRDRFVSRLEKISPEEWHRTGRHPEYADYDVCFQMNYLVHHEAHHIYQMLQRRTPFGKLPHEG